MSEGTKLNSASKVRLDLVPPEAIYGIARGLTFGQVKGYDARDWEKGMKWGDLYGATQRHLNKFWAGIDWDAEAWVKHQFAVKHLELAMCELAMLHTHVERQIGVDNRFEIIEEEQTSAQTINSRYFGEDIVHPGHTFSVPRSKGS